MPASCFSRYRFGSSTARRAFSLVEVVIAVGVFALAVVSVIGLLAPLGSSVSEVRDGDDAARVATTIQSGLQDEVNRLKRNDSSGYWDTFADYLEGNTVLYASRDGTKVGPIEPATTNLAIWDADKNGSLSADEEMDRFFEVTLRRNTALSPDSPAADAAAGFLAFNITLRWPGYVRTGESTTVRVFTGTNEQKAQQGVLILPAAVVR